MHRNKLKLKHNNPKPMGFSKSSAKGKVHSNTSLSQETRNQISNLTRKEEMEKSQQITQKYKGS